MLLEAPIIENIQIKQEIIINKPHVKSKLEEYCYEKLLTKYTVIRQYKEKRYPFKCDFYIPELDLFIELNAFEGHGFHPYNPKNKLDKEKLKIWEEKSKGLKPNGQ